MTILRLPHHKPISLSEGKKRVLKHAHLITHVTYLGAAAAHYGGGALGIAAGGMGVIIVFGAIMHVEL